MSFQLQTVPVTNVITILESALESIRKPLGVFCLNYLVYFSHSQSHQRTVTLYVSHIALTSISRNHVTIIYDDLVYRRDHFVRKFPLCSHIFSKHLIKKIGVIFITGIEKEKKQLGKGSMIDQN